jgi:ribosomal-protein-alanine N-acetyltransferase
LNPPETVIRKATLQDKDQLTKLLQKESFIHRHLGWQPPLAWLPREPYLVLEREKSILSVLACPPDEDGICWLRLFAVAPEYSIYQAWNSLWVPAVAWLQDNTTVQSINCLVVQNVFEDLLKKAGLIRCYDVIVLVWDILQAKWAEIDKEISVRSMHEEDIPRVYEIDGNAFETIWRNSLGQLRIALIEACFATVAVVNNEIVGYQISTRNPRAGHLARLAVDPIFQNQGVGSALLGDLLDRFQRQGLVQVTVNTQSINQASIELYQRFGFQQLDEIYPVYQHLIGKRKENL